MTRQRDGGSSNFSLCQKAHLVIWRMLAAAALFAAIAVLSLESVAGAANAEPLAIPSVRPGFVGREGTHFILDGKPFFVAGVNNHYLAFGSAAEVTRVLDDAVAMGANVVRTFIIPVIGDPNGLGPRTIWDWERQDLSSNQNGVHGNYLIYWDTSRNAMAVNEGASGLQKLDFLIDEARKRKLKLIIALLDFWDDLGGAQQFRAWYGSEDQHTFFFQDPRTKSDYKSLVRSVLLRVNTLNGTTYRNDETIFAWELMNEPDGKPRHLLYSWISEMSSFVKSIDENHMVSSGKANVDDRLSDIDIPSIDFATWHGYPLYYKKTPDQMNDMITEFCGIGAAAGKPVLMEEFGYARSNSDYVSAYRKWMKTVNENSDCAGWLVWRLVSLQDDLRYPSDPQLQFDVHNDGGELWNALTGGARGLTAKNKETKLDDAVKAPSQ